LPPVSAEDLAVGRRAWEEARDRRDADALGEAERALYILATRADAAAIAALRDTLARQYDRDAAAAGADAFRQGAASYALVLVSLQDCLLRSRVDRPARFDEESTRAFLGRVAASREARQSVVRWAFRTFQHAAAAPQAPAERAFLLNRAIALLLTVPDYAADAAGLDARLKEFQGLKRPLAALCPETDTRKGRYEIGLDDFEKTLARLADQAADGQAVRALVGRHRDAYNRKDAAAFRALFLPDARAVLVLAAKPMEDTIGFTEWEFETEDPYTVWVAGDTASIEVLTRYRDRDGRLHGYQVSGLRARRTPDGWRLE
jgi:hypothetical protein